VATIANLLVVSIASYRGAAYMDSPQFCGQSCHVMHPEYTAYKISAHSHVACVDCHIGSGAAAYFSAKVNGTKQLLEVTFRSLSHADSIAGREPAPGPLYLRGLPHAGPVLGEKLLVKSSFADDEKNTETQTVVVLHLGGEDSLSHLTGIHGVHLGHIEYIATDPTRTTIPWVQRQNADGSKTVFAASAGRRRPPGRTAGDGLHRLPQPRGAHLCDRGRRDQPGHGRGRGQSRAALGPQGGPGAAESQLCQPRPRPRAKIPVAA
jgi:hypothetical protein